MTQNGHEQPVFAAMRYGRLWCGWRAAHAAREGCAWEDAHVSLNPGHLQNPRYEDPSDRRIQYALHDSNLLRA
jgi:hypothetical protein